MKITPIILAGGFGTRLKPLSTREKPKQFLALINEKSLLQNTLERLNGVENIDASIILCNQEHISLVNEQLSEIGLKPHSLIIESIGRNTAPAIAIAALQISQKIKENTILLVLPADHAIKDIAHFHQAITQAAKYATLNHVVTFGVKPDRPETGYGYIEFKSSIDAKVHKIEHFVEKPDLAVAKAYFESGNYYWNSGMFMFSVETILQELKFHAPEIFVKSEKVLANAKVEGNMCFLPRHDLEDCPNISIDYAVMEKTAKGIMVELDAGWSDIGSWEALRNYNAKFRN